MLDSLTSLFIRMTWRGILAMTTINMVQSPENSFAVLGYVRTSLAYFGWLLVQTFTA